MAQRTAVEYLIEKLYTEYRFSFSGTIVDEAKAMEKEQIIDAHIEGQRVFDDYKHTQWTTDQAEKYYNETHCQYSGLPSVKSYE
jgi:hypothetical protein